MTRAASIDDQLPPTPSERQREAQRRLSAEARRDVWAAPMRHTVQQVRAARTLSVDDRLTEAANFVSVDKWATLSTTLRPVKQQIDRLVSLLHQARGAILLQHGALDRASSALALACHHWQASRPPQEPPKP
jgi:DNA-binding MurR/RpiR family transcriptional regulator